METDWHTYSENIMGVKFGVNTGNSAIYRQFKVNLLLLLIYINKYVAP